MSNRLVDYFGIVGASNRVGEFELLEEPNFNHHQGCSSSSRNNNSSTHSSHHHHHNHGRRHSASSIEDIILDNISFKPVMLDRYPFEDYTDSILSTELSLFALPCGVKVSRSCQLPSFLTFVLTGGDGARIYGCSLVFYETLEDEYQLQVIEHLVEDMKRQYTMNQQRKQQQQQQQQKDEHHLQQHNQHQHHMQPNDITELDAVDVEDEMTGEHDHCFSSSLQDLVGSETQASSLTTTITDPMMNNSVYVRNDSFPKSSSTTAVAVTAGNGNNNKKSSFRRKTLYISKSFFLVSHYPLYSTFKTFMTQLYRISITPSKLPIERFICNFLKEVPLPPQGRIQVQYTVGEKTIMISRPPENTLPMSDLSYEQLFKSLSVDNILFLLNCILNEKQILLYSSRYSLLGTVAETLTSLMCPFQWHHVYIPLLPKSCMEFLSAPVPFIMGTHTSFLEGLEIPSEVVQVDLDRNTIVHKVNLPPLPERQMQKLKGTLPRYVRDRRECHEEDTTDLDLAFDMAPMPDEIGEMEGVPKVFPTEKVRMAFFRIFISLFQKYKSYLKLDIRVDNILNFEPENHFRKASFIRDQRESAKPFIRAFLETQAFQRFLLERVLDDNSPHIRFFDESIQAKLNRSKLKLYKLPTPFLSDKSLEVNNTIIAIPADASRLPMENIMYVYPVFPRLSKAMFNEPREVKQLVSMSDCQSRNGEAILASWKTILATLASLSQQVVATEDKRRKLLKNQYRKVTKCKPQVLHTQQKSFMSEDFDTADSDLASTSNLSTSVTFAGAPLYVDISTAVNHAHPLSVFSRFQFDTRDVCPDCHYELSDADVKLGWSGSTQDYRTTCPNCLGKFVPRFSVIVDGETDERSDYDLSSLANISSSPVSGLRHSPDNSPFSTPRDSPRKPHAFRSHTRVHSLVSSTLKMNKDKYEYLSPVVLKKEVENLLKKDVFADERLFSNHPLIFWNLILHFRELSIPLNILIPQVDWKSVLRSLCELKMQREMESKQSEMEELAHRLQQQKEQQQQQHEVENELVAPADEEDPSADHTPNTNDGQAANDSKNYPLDKVVDGDERNCQTENMENSVPQQEGS